MPRVAIVGGGLAGLVAYATLRERLEPGEIAIFGDADDPVAPWLRRAEAIRQQQMRSESDGHCFPRSFPGLAVREAARRGEVRPLLETVTNRYRPTVEEFVQQARRVRLRTGWAESFVRARVERLRAVDGGFELDAHGTFRHLLLALGHPGLAMPAELAGDARVVHAYEPHEYARRVAVVGAGMAAATEWLNALSAGAEVVSVRRREPERHPLNVPRPLFSKRGLAAFHATEPDARVAILQLLGAPSYPPGREWDEPLELAAREGRFRVEAELNGAEQVICATGFLRGFEHDPLLAALVADHDLETRASWIVLAPDATVPALTDERRTLVVAGVPAQWAYPGADTVMGMKYVARRFLRRVERCRTR